MPATCCVVGCGSRGGRDNVFFYRIPNVNDTRGRENDLKIRRRQAWLNAINRSDLVDSKLKNARICSRHFINGKPSAEDCETHSDWAPTKFLIPVKSSNKKSLKPSPSVGKRQRYNRIQNRIQRMSERQQSQLRRIFLRLLIKKKSHFLVKVSTKLAKIQQRVNILRKFQVKIQN